MKNNLVSSFPERLKLSLENNAQFTATSLAEEIGLSKQAISMYLSGDRSPKRPTIKVVAEVLSVNEAWLMGYDVPMERENKVILDQNGITLVVSEHEEKVIMEYRNHPSAQPFVDKLLGIEKSDEKQEVHTFHVKGKMAARGIENTRISGELNYSEDEVIKKLKDASVELDF